jgi:tRNA A-37 threonylcarbamoyl transferase component Bud32
MEEICKKLSKEIQRKKLLGKGKQGVVYDLGSSVMKVRKGLVNNEILLKASDAGISPKVFGIFICDGCTYIHMEKLTEPFLAELHGKQMASLITRMVKAGILHNDIHAENLMAKNGTLYLIDFDNATFIDTLTQKEFDKEFQYHKSYTDETYSKRFPIEFTKAQTKVIESRRKKLKQ